MNSRSVAVLLGLALGIIVGWSVAVFGPWHEESMEAMEQKADREPLYWVAPMDPTYRRDQPGKSPMSMDLVPVYESDEPGGRTISIDPQVVNNLGIKTSVASYGILRTPINTVGRIKFDQSRLAHIHLRSTGWIQRLAIRAEGEPVKRGDLLFEVYSPDLSKAQAEFVQALKGGRAGLIEATRERLRALGISSGQIARVEKTRKADQYIRYYAPISGIVSSLNVADGKYVAPESDIMVIADLSHVWLISDVFESQSDQVTVGAHLTARSQFDPGGEIQANIDYIYPDLDPITRTVPVRAVLDNAGGKLKLGMYMTVRIEGRDREPATLVPAESVIRTGKVERVILLVGEGRFQAAKVRTGAEADGMVEVIEGLEPGEVVVVSGQFLIDSESSFQGATLRVFSGDHELDHGSMNSVEHEGPP